MGEMGRGQISGRFFVTKMLSNFSRFGLTYGEICASEIGGSFLTGMLSNCYQIRFDISIELWYQTNPEPVLYEPYKEMPKTLYDFLSIST
jgi:hypothetical protein